MSKPRLACYWAASCGGCDIAVLELHERLYDLLEAVEVVFWPCVLDVKYDEVARWPDGSIDLCLFNGGIRTEENAALARLLRAKSRLLVAFGACASLGGIPGLANLSGRDELLARVYEHGESTDNPSGCRPQQASEIGPGHVVHLPALTPNLGPLGAVVSVDAVIPGCPPCADQIWAALQVVLSGAAVAPGAILGAGTRAVCDECPRSKRLTRPGALYRPQELIPQPEQCLLEQGLLCLGPATRSGCQAACLQAEMPCRGCYGPAGDARDQGAAMLGALGALLACEDEAAIARLVEQLPDLTGTIYRFSLPAATLAPDTRGGGR